MKKEYSALELDCELCVSLIFKNPPRMPFSIEHQININHELRAETVRFLENTEWITRSGHAFAHLLCEGRRKQLAENNGSYLKCIEHEEKINAINDAISGLGENMRYAISYDKHTNQKELKPEYWTPKRVFWWTAFIVLLIAFLSITTECKHKIQLDKLVFWSDSTISK